MAYGKFGVLIADILAGTLKHFFVPTDLVCFWTVHHEYSIGRNTKFFWQEADFSYNSREIDEKASFLSYSILFKSPRSFLQWRWRW